MELKPVLLEQFTELVTELLAEDLAECLDGQEESARRVDPSGTIQCKAAGGNDVVYVGMNLEVLSPGMEHADCSQFRHPLQSYAATAATLCRRCKRIVRAEGVVFKSTLAQTPGSSFSRAHRPASQSRAASGPTGSTEPIFFSSIVIVLYSSDMDNREWLEKIPLKMLIVVPATCAILNACFLMFARSGHGMQMSDTAAGSVSGVLLGIALLCVIVGAMRKSLAS